VGASAVRCALSAPRRQQLAATVYGYGYPHCDQRHDLRQPPRQQTARQQLTATAAFRQSTATSAPCYHGDRYCLPTASQQRLQTATPDRHRAATAAQAIEYLHPPRVLRWRQGHYREACMHPRNASKPVVRAAAASLVGVPAYPSANVLNDPPGLHGLTGSLIISTTTDAKSAAARAPPRSISQRHARIGH